ncbi:glycosyltransferase family 4 protein [Aeromonas sp. QDB20]|uniref:glycosyltransferase family 4 protein n=1 Tax=Aeromonas sp. QDB20 TaxID=2989835 RepID=UPI0022DED211|nr:glycosyltransferase family 4 protein [Aeromonas sp. QDB20]
MKKILHIVEVLEPIGGTSNKLRYLCEESVNGFDCYIICLNYSKMNEEFEKLGVKIIALNDTGIGAILKIRKQLSDISPDYVVTHFTRSLIFFEVASLGMKIKSFHHEHGPADLKPRNIHRKIEKYILRNKKFVVNSNYTAKTYISEYGKELNPIVIYNPFKSRSLPKINLVEKGLREINILHVGGLVAWRNQSIIIHAANILSKASNIAVNVYFVGDGDERINLSKIEINDSVKVYFEGYQTDLDNYYSKCQIYVNTATHEGFGIATVEAMAAGKLTFVANRSANVEIVDDNVNGFHFEANCAKSLAIKVGGLLLLDGEKQREIAQAGIEKVKQEYTKEKYFKNISLVLGSL